MRVSLLATGIASAIASLTALSACGGSSSETPFPQSAAEITTEPVLRRPRPAGSSIPVPPQRLGGRGAGDR